MDYVWPPIDAPQSKLGFALLDLYEQLRLVRLHNPKPQHFEDSRRAHSGTSTGTGTFNGASTNTFMFTSFT